MEDRPRGLPLLVLWALELASQVWGGEEMVMGRPSTAQTPRRGPDLFLGRQAYRWPLPLPVAGHEVGRRPVLPQEEEVQIRKHGCVLLLALPHRHRRRCTSEHTSSARSAPPPIRTMARTLSDDSVLVGIAFSNQRLPKVCMAEPASIFSRYGDMADATIALLKDK